MQARPSAALALGARRAWLAPAGVAALALLAYRPLFTEALGVPDAPSLEGWLFRVSQLPPPLVLAVAGWLLWRRRARLRAAAGGTAPLAAALLALAGASLYVWAQLTRTADLLLPSLAANGLALAAALGGTAAVRAALLPAAVLGLGVQIPAPLRDEIVWHLQVWTASGAAWLLDALGRDFVHGGVVLEGAEHSFHVIDGCSGYTGAWILLLASLLVRELFAHAGWRVWLVVPLSLPLAFLLNVLRIAYVAASPNPEALAGLEGDHTREGIAVLVAGSAALYGLGWALARSRVARSEPVRAARPPQPVGPAPWLCAAAGLAALAGVAVALPPFAAAEPTREDRHLALPESLSGWTSERLVSNPYFIGAGYRPGVVFHRRYLPRGAGDDSLRAVEVFLGAEAERAPHSSRFLSSKLLRPGPEWRVESRRRERVFVLGRDADLVVASRPPGGEHAVLYHWRLGHAGLWSESWRALLALDASPWRREERRRVVQIVAYAPHDGSLALDLAKQRLDRFVLVFRDELRAL